MSNKSDIRNYKSKNLSKTQRIKEIKTRKSLVTRNTINKIKPKQTTALRETIKPNNNNTNNNKLRKSYRGPTFAFLKNSKETNILMQTEEENIKPIEDKVEEVSELNIDFNYPYLVDIKDED